MSTQAKQVMNLYFFKLAEGANAEQFLAASQQAEEFIREQPGFLYRSVSRQTNSDQWIDTGYWESADAYQKVHQAFMSEPRCQSFMQLIDQDTLDVRHTVLETTSCTSE